MTTPTDDEDLGPIYQDDETPDPADVSEFAKDEDERPE